MKGKRKLSGVLLIIAALIIMQLPVSEADAATSASDFKMEGTTLVKYQGTEKNVSIPGTVEVVGESAFEDNDKIERVVVPKSVKRIEAYAFWSCDRLNEVVLGNGIQEVGDYAFTNCKGLKQMTLPRNVRSIGIQAFADCVNLKDILIPPEVTKIHETAFDGCAKLVIHSAEGSVADKYADEFYEKQKEMPEYEDVPEYSKPDVPGNIDKDKNESGSTDTEKDDNHTGENKDEVSYEGGNILGSTQIVGNQAVVFIDNTSPLVHDGSTADTESEDTFSDGDGVTGGDTINSSDRIPKYTIIDGKIVADQAYYRKKNLSSVSLPPGIEEIGQFAFARSSVTDVVIPNGTTKIRYGAFYHCDNLSTVALPDTIELVEPKAFLHSLWVENFMKNGTEDFLVSGNALIAYRGQGGTVTIPEGVSVIAGEVFAGNTEITNVILPESLRVIGEGAFEGCKNLLNVQMGSRIEQIKDRAFAGCTFSEIDLPASVKEIGLKAFDTTAKVSLTGNQNPVVTHELSAERLSNEAYRILPEEVQNPGVIVYGVTPAFAELEAAKRNYSLSVEMGTNPSRIQTAYGRAFQKDPPERMIAYNLTLTDESGIPLTKLGKQLLTVAVPLPEAFAEENVKVIMLDRNGQLEEVKAERVLLDGVDAVRFRTANPNLFGIYGDGTSLVQEGAVNEISTTIQNMSEAPGSESQSKTGGYMDLLKWSFAGILLLWGSVRIIRKK